MVAIENEPNNKKINEAKSNENEKNITQNNSSTETTVNENIQLPNILLQLIDRYFDHLMLVALIFFFFILPFFEAFSNPQPFISFNTNLNTSIISNEGIKNLVSHDRLKHTENNPQKLCSEPITCQSYLYCDGKSTYAAELILI